MIKYVVGFSEPKELYIHNDIQDERTVNVCVVDRGSK